MTEAGDRAAQGRRAIKALNRLAKWRAHFAGWQLGSRLKGDPEGDAVRDHREVTLLLRAEVSALVEILTRNGTFTEQQWAAALERSANDLSAALAQRWPGAEATDQGMSYDLERAQQWMRTWRP